MKIYSERERQICKHKRQYASRITAEAWSDIYHMKYPDRSQQGVYHCPVCKKYHLTSGKGDRDQDECLLRNSRLYHKYAIQSKEKSLQKRQAVRNMWKEVKTSGNDGSTQDSCARYQRLRSVI